MPQNILQITNDRLQPAMFPSDARFSNGKFGASKTFYPGSAIGRKTSDGLLYPCVKPNAVYTISITGTATAGTFKITFQKYDGTIVSTSALAFNASIATIQTALDTASGVTNGIVASSAASAAPMSTPTPLILTYSGTNYSASQQPAPTLVPPLPDSYVAMTGVTGFSVAETKPNMVQTVAVDVILSGGVIDIKATKYDGTEQTVDVPYNTSWTQTVADIQTALITVLGTAAVACAVTNTHDMTITFSGANYAGITQPLVVVDISAATGPTTATVSDTTVTKDGTEVAVGFAEFGFRTDANGLCYLSTTSASADLVTTASATMPYYISGTFKISDLVGWETDMLAQLGGRTIASGIIRIP